MQTPDNQLTEEEIRAALEPELFSTSGSMSHRISTCLLPSEPAILEQAKIPQQEQLKNDHFPFYIV